MKKIVQFGFLLSLIFLSSCQESQNEFKIGQNQVGQIKAQTEVHELESIFSQDSIVKPDLKNRFRAADNDYYVYQNGELALKIQPRKAQDSTSYISEIQILNSAYKTDKGLNASSTFKDLYENYKINFIQNSLKNVIVDLKDSGIYVVIDKKHLPSSLKFDSSSKVSKTQIPDDAPFKYFWFSFTEDK
ncbi:MAG: hypothetical protein ACTH3E_06855 [Psychroflexus halocasei]